MVEQKTQSAAADDEVDEIARRLVDLTLAGIDASARALSFALDRIVGPEPDEDEFERHGVSDERE